MGSARYNALVSVHDLMPSTLSAVLEVLAYLDAHDIHPVTLLVVPGTGWDDSGLQALRNLQDHGHHLAGHGWTHQIGAIRGGWHTAHSRLFSRNAAEHLALTSEDIIALIARCHRWFGENGLKAPTLYVPPAWAMGDLSRETLARLPFRYYEYLSGVYDSLAHRWHCLPLLGYEADTPWRVLALRLWNRLNRILACKTGVIRIAIHPFDLKLRLAKDLLLQLETRPPSYPYYAARSSLETPPDGPFDASANRGSSFREF